MKTAYVKDWMGTPAVSIGPRESLADAHRLMTDHSIRRLPVMEGNKLVGIVTLTDVLEAEPSDATSLSVFEVSYLLGRLEVRKIMSADPITVSPETKLTEAAALMLKHKLGGFPVMEGVKLVGVITESDIFRAFVQLMDE